MSDLEFAKAFLNKAKEDLQSAKILCDHNIFSNALYLAQQAAEKAAKAILILYGKFVPEHVVSELLIQLASILPEEYEEKINKLVENLVYLERYWLKPRYPIKKGEKIWDPTGKYTKEETEDAIRKAEECIKIAEEFLKDYT